MYTKPHLHPFYPLVPIGMGILQPDWIEFYETLDCPSSCLLPTSPCSNPVEIKINFHSR